MPQRSDDFIQSLERGLAVMNSFSREKTNQTLSEVAQMTGLTRATARRVLLTLTELGYVHQSSRSFSLTPKMLDLGYSYLSLLEVVEVAQQPVSKASPTTLKKSVRWVSSETISAPRRGPPGGVGTAGRQAGGEGDGPHHRRL